jgi:hypothetical protein
MTRSPRRLAAVLLVVTAAGLLAGCGSARATADLSAAAATAAQHGVVMVDCDGKPQTRPSSFVLTCADANDALGGMRWVSWGSQAFGTGTETINSCTPDCADGKLVPYPVLVAVWRPEPLPGHPGVQYFTRVTRIYTANHPPLYNCQGKQPCYPLTSTFDLWSRAING